MDAQPTRVRVALVNDYELVVRGLEVMLAPYDHRIEVVELNAQTDPKSVVDVALFDAFASSQSIGAEVDDLLRDPGIGQVVVYTWQFQPDLLQAARDKRINGYVSKSASAEDLVAAVEDVHAGRVVMVGPPEPEVRDPDVAGGDWPGRAHGLTVRQAEVIAMITQGLSNAEIASRAHISINTLKTYIREAYRRMGVSTRSQAVRWGYEHGFAPDRMRETR